MINIRLRILSFVVIAYMLMAFSWWSVLIWKTLDDAFRAKSSLLKIGMIAEGRIHSNFDFYQTKEYLKLEREYKRQHWMVAGEGIFFVLSLVAGVWLINRGYNKEAHANQQRRNFLLSITHELKSPIASVKLILETFQKQKDKLKPAQMDKLTSSGLKEADRLNALVTDLLLSARLETAYQLHLDHFDLDELVGEQVQKMEDKYPQVAFRYHCHPAGLNIEADKMGLTSVVLNLLENAIKYNNGQAAIVVNLEQTEKTINLTVADNGIGIDDQEKKRIFDKFYRVGSEDTRTTKGTGLGLFIVKEIVKAHKGRIDVVDNEPRGSIFRISLPLVN